MASPQWRDQPFLGNLQPEEPARSALHPSLSYIWSTTILDSIWWTMSEEYTALHQRTVLDYIWWTTLDYIWWTSLEDYTVYWTTFGGLHWTSFGGPHWRTILYTGLHLEDYIGLHRSVLPTYYWHCCAIGVGGLCTAVKCPVIIGRFRTA